MKALIVYYAMTAFYFLQAAGQMIAGFRYYPVSPWFYVVLNTGVAVLALLGLAAHFCSYPIWILSFYIAFTSRGNKMIKRLVNTVCVTICALPVLGLLILAVIAPFALGMNGRTTARERYSPDRQYVAVVKIVEAVPAGGSTRVSAGRYLDLGILGRYLPDRSLYEDNGTELPVVVFAGDGGRVSINGVSYELP